MVFGEIGRDIQRTPRIRAVVDFLLDLIRRERAL